jgi:WXG100 family type VII secretion target
MALTGADVARLRELASKFDGDANQLQGIITSLQTACGGSHDYWVGGNANKFRTEWEGLKPTFDKFVETLRDAGRAARTHADNQEQVSGPGS